MPMEIESRLIEIFSAVFELPAEVDPRSLDRQSSERWDSLGHTSLVTALESEFEISIGTADSLELDSFDSAMMIVEELLTERQG